ncbi:rhodopsin, G0-coupled-like isoform X1 [Pomacea canaliculata]|uniref:rhodopsin, G0-coupled-like isoform X1 n=1 Tax=Pomacea canaliculata TaxID=400727 RepID=UPI000D730979|nr:rhodopsin, G0-coupled-like isoform X1 [Pomacea canaliculata]
MADRSVRGLHTCRQTHTNAHLASSTTIMDVQVSSMNSLDVTVYASTEGLEAADIGVLSKTSYEAIGFFMGIVCAVSVVGNGALALIMVVTGGWRRPAVNLYVFTITCTSSVETMAGFPLIISSSLNGKWMFGDTGCTYYAFVMYTCVLVIMTCYLLITYHRYRVVVEGIPADNRNSRHWIAKSVAGAWTYALCWSICPFLGLGHFGKEPFGTSCSLDWTSREFSARMYNLLVVLCLLVLPLCSMVLFSARVISKLNMQITPSTNGLTSGLTEIEGRPTVVTSVFSESSFIQARAFKIILMTLVVFVLCWSPYGIMSLLVQFNVPISPGASVLPTIMAKTHCAIGPAVYFFSLRYYRISLRELLGMDHS